MSDYRRKAPGIAALTLLVLTPAAVLFAQSYGRSSWWDSGMGVMMSRSDNYDNPIGQVGVRNTDGDIPTAGHAFFEALGSNGRACITCHQPSNAMGLSAGTARHRWTETDGTDPLFAAVDGSNCPGLPQADRKSHSLLLEKGLIRIALPWPPANVQPDFRIEVVRDPTGCNADIASSISVYRRPRIAANFNFTGRSPGFAFMADGREPSLRTQAISAALTHEQASAPPTAEQLRQIVDFESQIYTAQAVDHRVGTLYQEQGPLLLGPEHMLNAKAGPLSPDGFWHSFDAWKLSPAAQDAGIQKEFRASVARGSSIFSSRTFPISGVKALAAKEGTCATCHAAGLQRWMDIGTVNQPPEKASSDLPLFRVTCNSGAVIHTQDPGRALITGRCADVGAIVIQQFRGLTAREPYFSNGSAASLRDVVDFYDDRFHAAFTEQEKRDLVNFLSVL